MEIDWLIPRNKITQSGDFPDPKGRFSAHQEYVVQALKTADEHGRHIDSEQKEHTYLSDLIAKVVDSPDTNVQYHALYNISRMLEGHYLDIEPEDLEILTLQIGGLALEDTVEADWQLDSTKKRAVTTQGVFRSLVTKLIENSETA